MKQSIINEMSDNLLLSIYKNTCIATCNITNVISHIKSEQFSTVLKKQMIVYNKIQQKCEKIADEIACEIKDVSFILKSMNWIKIKLKSLSNYDDSKIATLLIQETALIIITITKSINVNKSARVEVIDIARNLKTIIEQFSKNLKTYLKAN